MKWINIPSIFSGLFVIIIFTGCAGVQKPSLDAHYYFEQGIEYSEKGQYDNAISDFNKALEVNPNYADAYYNRGIAYGKKEQYDNEIPDYNKALEVNPNYAEAYFNRGVIYEKRGQYDNAISDFNKAL